MKFINEFSEGDKIDGIYLVGSVTKGKTNSGSDYLSLNLQDKTGEIASKLWQVSKELFDTIASGQFVKIHGNVIKYRDNLQLKLDNVTLENKDGIALDDYIKTAPLSKDELRAKLAEYVKSIDDEIINKLVTEVLAKYKVDLYDYPAASKNHHAYHGGLIYHVVSMLNLAKALSTLYPSIDTNYLYAGIILHDLGKIEELSGIVATEYTTKGKLLGHISILHAQLLAIAKTLGYEEAEQTMILEHMVLSHHGKLEYGSPVLPMTREAELISFIDNIDARMDTLDKAYENVAPGGFTSRIFALENRSFYKYINTKK